MVRLGRRCREAGRQPVRDRDRQGVDGSAGDFGRHAGGNPCAGGRSRAGRRRGGADTGRAGEKASAPLTPAKAGVQESKTLDSRLRGNERQIVPPANKPRPTMQMEPFREVRSPERNYGPARLPGGTVVTPLARRLAGEGGIDLANLKGSGPHGRIVARDVETARSKVPALPQTPTSAQPSSSRRMSRSASRSLSARTCPQSS